MCYVVQNVVLNAECTAYVPSVTMPCGCHYLGEGRYVPTCGQRHKKSYFSQADDAFIQYWLAEKEAARAELETRRAEAMYRAYYPDESRVGRSERCSICRGGGCPTCCPEDYL